jgi:hypothetical protein
MMRQALWHNGQEIDILPKWVRELNVAMPLEGLAPIIKQHYQEITMKFLSTKCAVSFFSALCLVSGLEAAQPDQEIIYLINEVSRPDATAIEEDEVEIMRDLLDQQNVAVMHLIPACEHPIQLVDDLEEGEEECVNNYGLDTAVTYSTTHRAALHRAINISGDCIQIEDKSIWQVHGWDKNKIHQWNLSDTIVIAPNTNIFTRWSYPYKLINLETLQVAKAKMKITPVFNDPNVDIFVHWIVSIDYKYGLVRLEDGSLWKIHDNDKGGLKSFSLYSIVIVGTNDGWYRTSNPNILICVKNSKHVRGIVVN